MPSCGGGDGSATESATRCSRFQLPKYDKPAMPYECVAKFKLEKLKNLHEAKEKRKTKNKYDKKN